MGRGGWSRDGFPPGTALGIYTGRPAGTEQVGWAGAQPGADLSARAVNQGVRQIQHRVGHLAGCPVPEIGVNPTGILDGVTWLAVYWAQHHMGLVADGQAGPVTCKHLFWPYLNSLTRYGEDVRRVVGGITQHESSWDPGAVGFSTPDDLGLVQINGPANPTLSEADRFNYELAFIYACERIQAALATPGFTVDAAIASYGYPAVAQYWAKSGTETFPADPALNDLALKYVAFVKGWSPGF
jgi:hypothetical protein